MKKLVFVVGTRPEIVKTFSVLRNLKESDYEIIHTGQHYDFNLSDQFIRDLHFPQPKWNLSIMDSSSKQVSKIMLALDPILGTMEPSMVVVEGDTNSTLASAIAANKLGIQVAHIESGLRSRDFRMPEEFNRIMVDHISSFLFAPTQEARDNLIGENVWGAIHVTGNSVIDACEIFMPHALETSHVMDQIKFAEYILVTAHRQENVDSKPVLKDLVDSLLESPIPVVFPVHPRTLRMLIFFDLLADLSRDPKILLLPPQGYLDFLVLMKKAKLILSDSGGIQEEATAPSIKKFVLVWRQTTERIEAVKAGFAEVVGTSKEFITKGIQTHLDKLPPETKSPYGDGNAGSIIASLLMENI